MIAGLQIAVKAKYTFCIHAIGLLSGFATTPQVISGVFEITYPTNILKLLY
jgi:hypothetical protein